MTVGNDEGSVVVCVVCCCEVVRMDLLWGGEGCDEG